MTKAEVLLKLSQEGREWAKMLLPVLTAAFMGIHLPQPPYMKK